MKTHQTTSPRWAQGIISYLFLGIIFLAVSCTNAPGEDIRPQDQKSFVREVKKARDMAKAIPLSDPNRAVPIDRSLIALKAFINDSLANNFADWNTRVLDHSAADPNGGEIRITFGSSLDNFDLEETSRFNSIIFRQFFEDADPALQEKLKALKVGDHLQISGKFVSRDKRIDVDPYNEKNFKASKNIFENPEFRVQLTDVKKVED